jgi:hypothetical protein
MIRTAALPVLSLVVAASLFASAGQAQTQTTTVTPATTPTPTPAPALNSAPNAPANGAATLPAKFVIDSGEVNLGVISDEKTIERVITFRNEGTGPLTFKKLQGSCGCTVPRIDEMKPSYAPGEGGEIKVGYNPHNRNGPQHTQVTIETNDPTQPSVIVHIKSDVRPLLRLDPMVINLGRVHKDSLAKQIATISNRIPGLKIEQAIPSSPKVVASLGTLSSRLENGEAIESTPIEVSVSPTATPGRLNEAITIRTSQSDRLLTLTVMGEVLGDIVTEPAQLSFSGLTPGQPINSQFRLVGRKDKPFKITSVQDVAQQTSATPGQAAPSPIFAVAHEQDATAEAPTSIVRLTGTSPQSGQLRGTIVVNTDSVDMPQIRVDYFGFVRQPMQAQPRDVWEANPSALTGR